MLLDTNALLWLYRDSPHLGPESRAAIEAADRVFVSAVSITEITMKHMLGRIELPGGESFPEIFARSGLRELPFTVAHAAALADDPALARHDPFDRMLVAQARVERIPLITSDRVLLSLGEDRIHDARQ
ncbi:type II toxin-antitoxin system VapC family toxin [Microbacterium immunditiarum]|uniref:PIN domain nuclease of toxin-antitoxin system n=1 Tax=Microbacterium immunditiarum TaxID=337480 RepID=A0A7Y9GKL2_9MICO|nr:type II toxin-antitoxin system VapC family toxin [Microbacterium immunditiarum]NYE18255.1 PIN domain nuclease of toxin-antitoxin system [Microbacterium immunditiarum]